MADSEAAICNVALARIGHTQFIDTLDDASTEAEVCKRLYPACRDELLELIDWPFARRRYKPAQILATTLDLAAVPGGWAYAFALPTDGIPNGIRKIGSGLHVEREDQAVPYDIEYDNRTQQNILLIDVATPEVVYTMRLTDTKRFAPTFDSAVAWRLAIDLILPLRKDAVVATRVMAAYDNALNYALALAQSSVRVGVEPKPQHLAARG